MNEHKFRAYNNNAARVSKLQHRIKGSVILLLTTAAEQQSSASLTFIELQKNQKLLQQSIELFGSRSVCSKFLR